MQKQNSKACLMPSSYTNYTSRWTVQILYNTVETETFSNNQDDIENEDGLKCID